MDYNHRPNQRDCLNEIACIAAFVLLFVGCCLILIGGPPNA
jgi:hypothetical protein